MGVAIVNRKQNNLMPDMILYYKSYTIDGVHPLMKILLLDWPPLGAKF